LKFLPKYDQRLFTFTDLGEYHGIDLGLQPIDPLYVLFVKKIGYTLENLYDFKWLVVSILLSIFFTLPWIVLANKILSPKFVFFYCFLLGIHPYLSLYSLKIETGLFAILPVSLLVFSKLWPYSKIYKISLLTTSFLSLMRNSLIPMGWVQFLYTIFLKKRKEIGIIFFISLFILCFSSAIQIPYGMKYLNQEFGCYSFSSIQNWFSLRGFSPLFSNFFSFLVTPFIHLFLDLGAREAISFYCLSLPNNIANNQIINYVSTFGFLTLHLWCFIRLLKFCWLNKENYMYEILIPFSMLIPTLYGAAHLRYLMPLIPFLLLMAFIPINKKFKKEISYLK